MPALTLDLQAPDPSKQQNLGVLSVTSSGKEAARIAHVNSLTE